MQQLSRECQEAINRMSENPEGQIGEYWKFLDDDLKNFRCGHLYKQIKPTINVLGAFVDMKGHYNGFYSNNRLRFVKATKDEICRHFDNVDFQEFQEELLKPTSSESFKQISFKQGELVEVNYTLKGEPWGGPFRFVSMDGNQFLVDTQLDNTKYCEEHSYSLYPHCRKHEPVFTYTLEQAKEALALQHGHAFEHVKIKL